MDIGVDADDLPGRVEAFGAQSLVRFSAGVWPAPEAYLSLEETMAKLEASIEAHREKVVAIGEAGIDRNWNRDQREAKAERELFACQAELALRLDLPLIVHSRDGAIETESVLKNFPGLKGVIHCFSYGVEEARRFLDLGFYLSFAGNVTYKSAVSIKEAARYVGLDRMLLETDSPYLAPVPHRGKPSTPLMVMDTGAYVAELRGTDEETLASECAHNAERLFGGSPPVAEAPI